MNKLGALQECSTKKDLAALLGVLTPSLTYSLYVLDRSNQYHEFSIPKRNGGERTIAAPSTRLKSLQASLSSLLYDCVDEINKKGRKKSTLSHGFVREKSIITNASVHLGKKNVLNIDLDNFFDAFNFGRVRGFFIKNEHFKLDPAIATVIAQIACHENKLPQGSPCSPIITNLITHPLDIRLAALAKKYSCSYSRYADDITFSTRKLIFPAQIMRDENGEYIAGKKLRNEIERAGFSINQKKTRIQYKDSRQDVTGLIVNRKPNIKKEYWRTVRAQCHSVFSTGSFTKKTSTGVAEGNLNELEGQLNFIDQIDLYNRQRDKPLPNPIYTIKNHGQNTNALIHGRERTFSRFLYYRLFYGNEQPTVLCEGKTDNLYLKAAINQLVEEYPKLAEPKTKTTDYKLLIRFVKYSKRTRFLLELHGGTSYLSYFMTKFDKNFKFYKAPKPKHPVIIILDNDKGFSGKNEKGIEGKLKAIDSVTIYPKSLPKNSFREAKFIHVMHNLYMVLTPLSSTGDQTAIEDLFDDAAKNIKVSGKSFNPSDNLDESKEYGKEYFARHVIHEQKKDINFDGLKPLLNRVVGVIEHYDSTK